MELPGRLVPWAAASLARTLIRPRVQRCVCFFFFHVHWLCLLYSSLESYHTKVRGKVESRNEIVAARFIEKSHFTSAQATQGSK